MPSRRRSLSLVGGGTAFLVDETRTIGSSIPLGLAIVAGTTLLLLFLLTRVKEARDAGADNATAVALGLERTGRIVTAAALLFIASIGSFATSQIVTLKELAIGTGLAVAIDATIVRALLVPSLMRLLGGWNWWAPGPLRWLHAHLGLRDKTALSEDRA